MKKNINFLTQAAVIAACYAVLTMAMWEFSSLAIQCRVSEGLCVLALFTDAAVPGLFIGCLIANFMSGTWVDIVFGSLATLIAAYITRVIAKKCLKSTQTTMMTKVLIPLPTVLVNTLVIPFVLYFGYGVTSMGNATTMAAVLGLIALSIFIGEAISCYVVGIPLMMAVKKFEKHLPFSKEE